MVVTFSIDLKKSDQLLSKEIIAVLKLLKYALITVEEVLEKDSRDIAIDGMQLGFMSGKVTSNTIFAT